MWGSCVAEDRREDRTSAGAKDVGLGMSSSIAAYTSPRLHEAARPPRARVYSFAFAANLRGDSAEMSALGSSPSKSSATTLPAPGASVMPHGPFAVET